MPSPNSPLFRTASKAMRDAARRDFARTRIGQLVDVAQRELRYGSHSTWAVHQALLKYMKAGPREALRELRGTSFGLFARSVEHYARQGPMKRMLDAFLSELGPAGKLISALSGVGGGVNDELRMMRNLLILFGVESLSARVPKKNTPEWFRERAAIEERAQQMGLRLVPEEEPPHTRPAEVDKPRYQPDRGDMGPLTGEPAWLRQYPPDHPMRSGQMVSTPNSSNVHSIGYDWESGYLYVRYLGYVRGSRGPDGHPLRGGPGSLYRYSSVSPEEFVSLLAVAAGGSKSGEAGNGPGDWVWDHLRIRGTWSGHQKDYELVGIMGGYVPRKATVEYRPESGRLEEVFRKRRVMTSRGQWLESQLANEAAPPLMFGREDLDTGRPDSPDRGDPDRGFSF